MIHRYLHIFLFSLILLLASVTASHSQETPKAGEKFPPVTLPAPDNPAHREYLGLPEDGGETFSLSDIRAPVIIVEIFSMYCPHCQREAPALNKFYERLERTGGLRDKVKLIGIGAGNSAYEVEHFRKTYDIPFPLFPDGDFSIHKKVGEVRTPYFFGLKKTATGTVDVFFSELGGAKDAAEVLDELLKVAGLEEK